MGPVVALDLVLICSPDTSAAEGPCKGDDCVAGKSFSGLFDRVDKSSDDVSESDLADFRRFAAGTTALSKVIPNDVLETDLRQGEYVD